MESKCVGVAIKGQSEGSCVDGNIYVFPKSVSIFWLSYCTVVLQDIAIGEIWFRSTCIFLYDFLSYMWIYSHLKIKSLLKKREESILKKQRQNKKQQKRFPKRLAVWKILKHFISCILILISVCRSCRIQIPLARLIFFPFRVVLPHPEMALIEFVSG